MVIIDVTRLKSIPDVVVHCPTEDTAVAFVNAIKQTYPDHYFLSKVPADCYFSEYGERTCYSPYLTVPYGTMTYCDYEYFEEDDRNIISVFDLIKSGDFGDFDSSEVDIKSLFGME